MKSVVAIIKKFPNILALKSIINKHFLYDYNSEIKKKFGEISNLKLKRIYNSISSIETFIDDVINSLSEEKRIVRKIIFSPNTFLKSSMDSYVSISTMRRYYNEFIDALFKKINHELYLKFKALDCYL